ncbi:pseudouridine synthase [Prosthecobacter vanneervenii]|uniref:Pseudouridine synthase n=1 Tax=Prosthecobacter vanneervenii TaxID=48466 RepID=A0A7W7YET6_9BACT|nr:pseudouridine synthase [Prosthecobacter vanneervenii]MBB5034886.1 23S rRNA pseudouridine2605 synthase [Prosthecobacter vanneervenii]
MSQPPPTTRTGLARAMSKLGFCSRSRATELIRMGKVQVNHVVRKNPEFPVVLKKDIIIMDDVSINQAKQVYVMLNKPRGLVTSASDELGRETVYSCFEGSRLPHLSPVGRLDKASEGLLLFTNDNTWADAITNPDTHVDKTYHVQIGGTVDEKRLAQIRQGVEDEELGGHLSAKAVKILRAGEKNMWLEVILDEGRNRHIRRLLEAFNIEVLRLMRVKIGTLELGSLPKGKWRELSKNEIAKLCVQM